MAFTIIREDLARVSADAIVVPANSRLELSGGAGLEVAQAAGYRRMRRACKRLGGCPVGQAVATPGFKLPASHVIHAVGPIWRGGDADEAALLRSAYDNALNLALRLNAQSVALPLLSAGTYGYPVREAFEIAVEAIRTFLDTADMDVILVLFDKRAVTEGSRQFGDIAEFIDDAYAQAHAAANQARHLHRRQLTESTTDTAVWEEAVSFELDHAAAYPAQAFCPRCGCENPESARFCRHCGTSMVRWDTEAAAADALAMPLSAPDSAPAPSASYGEYGDFGGFGEPLAAATSAPEPLPKASRRPFGHAPSLASKPVSSASQAPAAGRRDERAATSPSLSDLLASMDAPFSTMLMGLIDARGLTDAQVYKRANISRQHFSKMRNPSYKPTKKTVVALALALGLSLDETRDLLARAGFALTHSDKFDIIIEYFISRGDYDIFKINEALFAYDQPLLN